MEERDGGQERQQRTRARVPEVKAEVRAGVHQRRHHLEVEAVLAEAVLRRSGRTRARGGHHLLGIEEHLVFERVARPARQEVRGAGDVHVLKELDRISQLARWTLAHAYCFREARIVHIHKEEVSTVQFLKNINTYHFAYKRLTVCAQQNT